jgi:hypothetical protein
VRTLLKSSALVLVALCLAGVAAVVLPALAGAARSHAAAPLQDPGLTLEVTPASLQYGDRASVVAHLTVPGATLQLSRAYGGDGEFAPVGTVVADGSGKATWPETPAYSATYRATYAGDATWTAATAEASVTVRAHVSLSTSAGARVDIGDRVTVKVSVDPVRAAAAVDVQEWDDASRSWHTLTTLTTDDQARAQWVWRPQDAGRHRLRARLDASQWSPVAVSGVRSVRVYDPSDPYGVPESYPHLILVDLSQYKLYYYEYGRVLRVFDCVLGRPSLPTPRGHFRIYAKDPDMYGAYGPRRMRYLGAYAVHGTNEPWLLDRWPRNYSHGCTRLSNEHILWLYDRVHVGTPVWNVP